MTEIHPNCSKKPCVREEGKDADDISESLNQPRSSLLPDDPGMLGSSRVLDDILPLVQKPVRYIGSEKNIVQKRPDEVNLRVALAFPDVYEVGMSHLGLKILYAIVNKQPGVAAERVFAPWPDMEAALRDCEEPLRSLETGTRLSEFDIVGFSLQYELCATTVLQMLELGGIPLRAKDRGPQDPIILGGGPTAYNPVPFAPFFDAFAIGDGEDLVSELVRLSLVSREYGESRLELLRRWKETEGVYIPALHLGGEVVSRRVRANLDAAEFPIDLVVPFCEAVHDRVGIEIARGCTRGCRFCQAGMVYRPVREREAGTILALARESLESTGWEEISLLSLSSGDYSCICDLLARMAGEWKDDRVAISLPSLRTETLDNQMAEQIRQVRKTGFTLAPEAGSERLRRVINKGNTEEDLHRAVTTAFEHGWQSVKLYFMIGLPTETDEDLNGIIAAIRKAAIWAKGKKINASVSTFVPKAHTPFQWAGQVSLEETHRRQNHIRKYFRKGRTRVKFHDPRTSYLEGVIARGDARVADVIESAYRKGARFDGWDDQLKFDAWMEAFREVGGDPEEHLRARKLTEELPWSLIDTGVDTQFLVAEWKRALSEETTGDCRFGECQGCGLCDFEEIYPRIAAPPTPEFSRIGRETSTPAPHTRRFRLRYGKRGKMRFLGHHDVVRTFHRSFRRAGLRLDYSKGFHPQPKLRFSPPLSVGVESEAEYLDFDLIEDELDIAAVFGCLQSQMSNGLTLFELKEIGLNEGPVSGKIRSITYELTDPRPLTTEDLRNALARYASADTFELVKRHKGKTRLLDLKEWIEDIDVGDSALRLTIKSGQSGSVNPLDALAAILHRDKDEIRRMKVLKKSVGLEDRSSQEGGNSNDRQ